jgi:integrase
VRSGSRENANKSLVVRLRAAGEEPPRDRRIRVERGIYRQPNGKYTVCFMLDGKPRFRTVGFDLELARKQRASMAMAARHGVLACAPQLRFAKLTGFWLERLQRRVAAGVRRERTLEVARYHLQAHLLPTLGSHLARSITAREIAGLIEQLRLAGRSEASIAGALHTLNNVMRFALRNDWIAENPVGKLEHDERPRPVRRAPRVLGQQEITALLTSCPPGLRPPIATALYTGLRISELLALTWTDLDLAKGSLRVRAQLSRATAGQPAKRTAPKTRAACREIPLPPQLVRLLAEHRRASSFTASNEWVFATSRGTPRSQRNMHRHLTAALRRAGIDQSAGRVRFHDLRHTFASHLIIDLGVDVVQVSRMLGHASPDTTLRVYAHMFDYARHTTQLHAQIAASQFARLLETPGQAPQRDVNVIPFPARRLRRRETPKAGALT